ncbi:PucR family transcriptional regulator [Bacillus testis]|uniref:PucR family transcriptional regulator n=1 Tax=Bacillus testis TaxID=1622072 RepID=UPI00067EA02C|nr:helix-turn-helix domain-containing protein [Bacillus testis]
MHNQHAIFKGLHGDLTEFVDRISLVLNCPVTLEDAHHRLLAYSVHNQDSDPIRISTIISRRVPEKVINGLWKQGIMPSLLKQNEPLLVPAIPDLGLGSRAAISVRKNNEVLGFIWAMETDHPFNQQDFDFLQFAAKEAKNQLLQLHSKKNRHKESKQEFLWQLLTGHFDTEQEINTVCIQQSISLPDEFSIATFTFAADISQIDERNISYMLSTIQSIKPILYTIDHRTLIILAGPGNENELSQTLLSFIPSFMDQMKIRFDTTVSDGACGQVYKTYVQARASYQEALYTRTIQHAFPERKDDLVSYSSLGIYQFLQIMHEHRSHTTFQESIERLAKYDLKNQSMLIHTLKIYLENDGDAHTAAKQLHLHVNTIHYRLKRIGEIGQINLKDPLIKMSLYLEFLLIQYGDYVKGMKA